MEFGDRRNRSWRRITLVVAGGLVLGALLTQLMASSLPPSAAREFFVTTVSANLGPLALDLQVLAVTLGPLVIRVNVLSAVGIVLVAWFARSLF